MRWSACSFYVLPDFLTFILTSRPDNSPILDIQTNVSRWINIV